MKKSLLIISLLLSNLLSVSQIDHTKGLWDEYVDEDYNYIPLTGVLDSRNGYRLSPHGEIRFLMAFVELDYSNPYDDPSPTGTVEWPVGQLPVWKDDLLEYNTPSGLSSKYLTKYFQMASSNGHIVLGDYLVAPDNGGVFKVPTDDGKAKQPSDIINAINEKLGNSFSTAHGFSSIADFDSWTVSNYGETKPNIENNKWDFVVFIIRNSKDPDNSTGYSSSFSSLLLIGHSADACAIVCTNGSNPTQIIRHEYAHTLLGGNNFHSGGGGFDGNYGNYWIPQTGGWGLLGLYGCSLWTWSAWDRYRLGWTGIGNHFEISARDQNGTMEVNGNLDATNPNHAGIFTLRDFATTGDALRIKLPFVNENEEFPEWIWVENHQGFVNNSCEFDRWQYDDGQHSCIEGMVPGMMLYLQINNERRVANESNLLFKEGFHADYTRPLLANGHWDLQFPSEYVMNGCVSYDTVRPFIRLLGNPLTGANDQDNYTYDKDGDDLIKKKDQLSIWTEQTANGVLYRHLYSLGHSSHVFTLQDNCKIGMGTNPSTATQINMVGEDMPYSPAKNLRNTYLNGVSIEMIEQCLNGDIRVSIRFDDVDVDNDVRWCADSIILNKIPTSSGYSLNVKQGKTILLDQGLTATRMRNPINYHGQKIFASPTTFIVQPDVKIHLDTTANIVLENSSKLYFRERSSCVIEDRGTIVVKRGTVLQLDDCASLVINGTGKLIVEEGAELRISLMATLAFQNGLQNLEMESGVIIYHIFANPNSLIANTISNAVITSSTTWSGLDCRVNGSIVVENGATLSIESSLLRFNDYDGRVVVKQGGKLIIDGSVLKSEHNCSDMWQGIEVWGNSSMHQATINGVCGQGFLELKNGAVIENAKCAVELWHPGDYTTTGGIIHATDAFFRNNATAVRALCYNNYHPYTHAPKNYNAYFNNCSFVVDENYLGTETFEKHVALLVVDGIEFKGCDFSAARSANGVDPYCKGLFTFDASFSVTSPCTTNNTPCPWEEMDHSTFTGLYSGILAFGGLSNPRTFVVREAIFSNNDYGINVLNSHFPTIIFNDFEIGGGYCDFNYGVCLKNSTSFSVEENHFHPTSNTTKSTVGVAICNSNSINDVYRNTFDGLSIANLALGQNTEISNGMSAGRLQGLTYTCNEFDGNGYDIMALKEEGVGNIQFQQGTSALPAGNIFENSTFQIYNDGVNQIAYYYNPNGLDETPNTSMLYRVTPQSANGSNNCISHYGNNPVVKSPSEKAELAMEYLAAYNAYLDLRRLYESHMDDSDTADPTADNSPAAEMLQVGAQMAQYSHEYTLAAGDIVRSNLNDSVANPTELRTWLGNMNDIAADRMIVSSYIQEGDSANAFTLANMLPAKHDMKGDQLTDHGCYMRLINLHQALHRSKRNIFQLTETEANLVRDIAENGLGVSQSMAEAILEQITDRSRDACFSPELPNGGDGDKGIMTHSNITEKEEKVLNVSVAPNPATTWTTVNYSLPKQGTRALLTLTNVLGVNVLSMELEGAQGSKVLDLRNLAAGVYVYTIRYEQFTEIGKLVIEK